MLVILDLLLLCPLTITGSQSSGESLKMEMAQDGFSAVYGPGVTNDQFNSPIKDNIGKNNLFTFLTFREFK